MKHANLILANLKVAPVLHELRQHPDLWDRERVRTTWKEGPFLGTSDIWVRWADPERPEPPSGPHVPAFYPAWHALPPLHGLVFDVMRAFKATMLGGILITKVPAGGQVKPHTDKGFWHPEFYRDKAYVIFQSNERCVNRFEDEDMIMRAGECWAFDNLVTHSVENYGECDRIAAVICMRTT